MESDLQLLILIENAENDFGETFYSRLGQTIALYLQQTGGLRITRLTGSVEQVGPWADNVPVAVISNSPKLAAELTASEAFVRIESTEQLKEAGEGRWQTFLRDFLGRFEEDEIRIGLETPTQFRECEEVNAACIDGILGFPPYPFPETADAYS